MVHLQGLERQFGGRVLFAGLDWLISPGARIGLVGPNGAGKTTLLRLIDGRDAPDAGAIHRPQQLRVGYLPQEVETVDEGSVLSVVLAGFEEVARIERQLEDLERRLAGSSAADPEIAQVAERYGRLRSRFEQLDGDRLEARARTILSGLGVAESSFHAPLVTLSGGWRMRVVLARLLLGTPDLLLLDEPTNHLDLEAMDWLEGFLEEYAGSFVVVSHDRYFLNRMVREIVELMHGKLTRFPGNYDAYVAAREARAEALEQAAKQQARQLAKVERFIERFRYKNTKARQVQSRVAALSRVERIVTERGQARVSFGFPRAPRSGDVVLRLEGVAKSYGERTVYSGLDLLLRRGDRVALVGPNGAGKSTLLRLIAGRIEPDRGSVRLGQNVMVQYYAQHQLDELHPESTVLEELERVSAAGERLRLRKLLGCFLFTGDDVDKRVGVLSGGEKARLALARLLLRPTNLLLLDEPTNHLDLPSRRVLEEALDEYAGTLVVISHDRYFINRVVTSVAQVGAGRVEVHAGAYDEYLEWSRRQAALEATPPPAPDPERSTAVADREARREGRRLAAEERNRRYRERLAAEQKLGPLETEIAALEQRVREVERDQATPEVYSDPERAAEAGREKARAEARLAELYEQWERAARTLAPD